MPMPTTRTSSCNAVKPQGLTKLGQKYIGHFDEEMGACKAH